MSYAYSAVFKVNVKNGTWCKKPLQQGHNYLSLAFKFTNCTTFVNVLEIDRTMKVLFLLVKTEFNILTSAFTFEISFIVFTVWKNHLA